ncbi:MAG: extracellular solute-binding protein [Propionicimonas sp.]
MAPVLLSSCAPAASAPSPTITAVDPWSERGPITVAVAGVPGVWDGVAELWNQRHPDEPVTAVDLPPSANRRHAELSERAEAKSGEFSVIALDPTWTAEFASKGWLTPLPASRFPTEAMLPAPVASASWQGDRYAYPVSADAGLLYYRKDLLEAAGVDVPTTWAEVEAACARVRLPSGMSCWGAPLAKDEGLTVNLAEAVSAAGGQLVSAAGVPEADSPAARAGLDRLVDGLGSGLIGEASLSASDQDTVRQFAEGKLLFARGWATARHVLETTRSGDAVAARTGTAQLPGRSGVAGSVQGGENLAISSFARNRGTAADFLAFAASDEAQRALLERGARGPVLTSLYADPGLAKRHPDLSTLSSALESAVALPVSVRYDEVTAAIQEQATAALRGEKTSEQALTDLQSKLEPLLE